tara:strand:- start:1428 stop:1883 length:456 start_codon:yes stop_codon:yes gene_type:complete
MTNQDKIVELFCAGEHKLSYALMKGLDEPLDLSKITLEMLTGGNKCDIKIPMNDENEQIILIRVDPTNKFPQFELVITVVAFDFFGDKDSARILTRKLWSILNDNNIESDSDNVIEINNYYHCIGYSLFWKEYHPKPVDLTKLLNFIINYE